MAHIDSIVIINVILGFILAISTVCIDADGTVRLVNNFDSRTNLGRVEVKIDGGWATICDDEWDIRDADVVCRQLGYTGAHQALSRGFFGPGTGVILLDNVGCSGDESRIQDCPNAGWGVHNCVHQEDASVECSSATVRLVSGPSYLEGNVQVRVGNGNDTEWGYVCDYGWDYLDGDVACRQLDQRDAEYVRKASSYGSESDGRMVLNNVSCSGSEYTLQQCPTGELDDCKLSDKAGVSCTRDIYEEGSLRLAGTGWSNRGRVEIYHNGDWGTICDDYWDYSNAKVVCRQLGYLNSQPKAYINSYYGVGQGRIWLDNVQCGGSESRLENCISSGWGVHDCSHAEDAGVYCDERGQFDAAEITGIILASLFGASILFCCVKYICCEAATNKRHQRRRRSRSRGRQSRRSPTTTTRPTDPEEHFNAHFNNAYTISGDVEEIYTPPGFLRPPPFPGSALPPLSPADLPPAYETIMSTPAYTTAEGSSVPAVSPENALNVAPGPTSGTSSITATNPVYPPGPLTSQPTAIPANPSANMPPIESVVPSAITPPTCQVKEKKDSHLSTSSYPSSHPVTLVSHVQQPPEPVLPEPGPLSQSPIGETNAASASDSEQQSIHLEMQNTTDDQPQDA